jgi:acyl-coenzyme A thioesterase PaaI-like protein
MILSKTSYYTVPLILLATASYLLTSPRPSKSKAGMSLTKLQRFLGVTHKLIPTGFGSILRITPSFLPSPPRGATTVAQDRAGKTLTINYTVPSHLCPPSTNSLPLSIILSLFDDVSTWPCVIQDPTMRAGVSVHLSGSLIDPRKKITPGTEIVFSSTMQKLGGTLAFLKISARDAKTNELLAVGRHTKYLPMGKVYDILFGRLLGVLELYANYFGRWGSKNAKLESSESANILDIIGELPCSTSTDGGDDAAVTTSNYTVNKLHRNPMGGLHGGAQGVIAEIVSEKHFAEVSGGGGSGKVLKSMSVSYASMGKGELVIKSRVEGEGVVTTIERAKGGMVAEGKFVYE